MITNKKIRELLKKNYSDFGKFAKFIGISRQGLDYRLNSDKLKDNLAGVYIKFLINQKDEKI